MQNPIQKFRQSFIVLEKFSRYFTWKFEKYYDLQLPYSSIFLAEISHTFST